VPGDVADCLGRADGVKRSRSRDDRLSLDRSGDDVAPRIDDATLAIPAADELAILLRLIVGPFQPGRADDVAGALLRESLRKEHLP
jgi:hypothetical protein